MYVVLLANTGEDIETSDMCGHNRTSTCNPVVRISVRVYVVNAVAM